MKRTLLAACSSVALAACAPAPAVGPAIPVTIGEAQSFAAISQDVLGPSCATASCHAGDPPTVYPQLDAGVAWEKLVAAPSYQATTMNLVEPYDPAHSYLVAKLRNLSDAAGGSGAVMPVGLAAIDEAEIQAIEAWIANGAPND
jgi:hypothetical protein